MVDYSQWLESVNWDPIQWVVSLGIAVLLVVSSIFIARMGERIEGVIRGIFVLGSIVLVVGLAGGLYLAFCQPPKDDTFARETERVFGVERITCDGGCPVYGLPDDRTPASWMHDGRLVKGTILVDGHKVGLAGADGEPLKAVSGIRAESKFAAHRLTRRHRVNHRAWVKAGKPNLGWKPVA